MTSYDAHELATVVYMRIRGIVVNGMKKYVPILDIMGMIKSTDAYMVEEDDDVLSITFIIHKKEVKQ